MKVQKMTREEILELIKSERLSQLDKPGVEFDHLKTKNDWSSLIGYYLFETSSRKDKKVSFEDFRSSLIQVAALSLAALEHSYNHEEKSQKAHVTEEIMGKMEARDE